MKGYPDATGEVFESLITSPVVRKVNFTNLTAVGWAIASKIGPPVIAENSAGANLRPVLPEAGGKDSAIVLEDADLNRAVCAVVEGATLNIRSVARVAAIPPTKVQNGQIRMSTYTVLFVKSVAAKFREPMRAVVERKQNQGCHVINEKSQERIEKPVKDATSKGAVVSQQVIENFVGGAGIVLLAFLEDIEEAMDIFSTESFGPVLALKVVENIEEAIKMASQSRYGLSSAI